MDSTSNLSKQRRQFLAISLVLGLSACDKKAFKFNSIDITGADYCRDFELNDSDGKQRQLADFKGRYVLVFFGFTQCPDICPTALARAAAVKQKLGKDGDQLQVIFISIDPERDTADLMRAYTQNFDPSFIGLRGTAEQTKQVADEFKVFYAKVATGSSYTMDHSTLSYLFDTTGKIRLAMRHEHSADQFASDIRQLMQHAA
ncbi:SCO family protein [Undibacterium baiyunense]|uniref:SCO family protein n=1 Tax=Undibacterium baiyunense TaxID=2828731 RepID=A0A941DEU1_9BURK|nr:SCO family protein [Undibacterium baiyunense]MBR7746860.1 SCO family protein [Undibacterium baiyunense]